jgi:GTP-binding protein HflX
MQAEQIAEVERVLAEIGAAEIPQLVVFNQIDRLEETQRPRALRDEIELGSGQRATRIFISARTGEGLDELRRWLADRIDGATDDLKREEESPRPAEASDADATAPASEAGEPLTGTYHSRA